MVYRIGQLGDTIVALPAIHALRAAFPQARLTLLSDFHPSKSYVAASDLLCGSGLVDCFETYAVSNSWISRLLRPFRMIRLLVRLRARQFDALAYLAPSSRTRRQIDRDRKFFGAAGISRLIGMQTFPTAAGTEEPLGHVQHEADFLLSRLADSGIATPREGEGCMDLRLNGADAAELDQWLAGSPALQSRSWIGFGPGSKMPAKKWALDRFEKLGLQLIERFDSWPVIFGGIADKETGDRLLRVWKRGFNAAGQLGVRASAAALRRCLLYVGNDTGTMHLAAAAGTPCVAIFSARDCPGKWNPYGARHRVLRARIECEGCMLINCVERENECLKRVEVSEVLQACAEILAQQPQAVAHALG